MAKLNKRNNNTNYFHLPDGIFTGVIINVNVREAKNDAFIEIILDDANPQEKYVCWFGFGDNQSWQWDSMIEKNNIDDTDGFLNLHVIFEVKNRVSDNGTVFSNIVSIDSI